MRTCYPNEKLLSSRLHQPSRLSITTNEFYANQIFPNPLWVTEKFGSISFAWLDRYNYKSLQIHNISPYLGPPISGDNIHALYIIFTLLLTSLQLVLASNLPIWCELGAKACKTAISCFQVPISYLQSKENIRNPKKMTYHHINTSTLVQNQNNITCHPSNTRNTTNSIQRPEKQLSNQ